MLVITALVHAGEGFETIPAGPLLRHACDGFSLEAADGHAAIVRAHPRSGQQALHVTGGTDHSVTMVLPAALPGNAHLAFWVERWTSRPPFAFNVECDDGSGWKALKIADGIKVGGYHERIGVDVPPGSKAVRFRCNSDAGVLIDDLEWSAPGPLKVSGMEMHPLVVPVLTRKEVNPALGFSIKVKGTDGTAVMESISLSLDGTTRLEDIARLDLVSGPPDANGPFSKPLATIANPSRQCDLNARVPLQSGDNSFWISVKLKDNADVDGRVVLRLVSLKAGGSVLAPPAGTPPASQRIGVGLRLHGDDGSKFFRIPGIARSNAGTLLAVYDVRYDHAGDLPANIDIGVSRSTDGGKSWGPMAIAMDMGKDPAHGHDGIGDPAILVDTVTGRIWIAALWSHGNRAWHKSGPGLTSDETGQLMISHSDDDGLTWSKPRNLTAEVKDPRWRLLLAGPGSGITTRDGTLVFAAQFRSADGGDTMGKPFSTILTSKDRGKSWRIGTGARIDTTEAQVVELADGSLMLNCRDNRGGSRSILVTRDLGKSWQAHPTDRKDLPEPVCMASLLRWDRPGQSPVYLFSNPARTDERSAMTIKVSGDNARDWPERLHTLYDSRKGAGYSCLVHVDATHVGVLYEGQSELYFLRIPKHELLAPPASSVDPGTEARGQAPAALIPWPRDVAWQTGSTPATAWKVKTSGNVGRAAAAAAGLPAPGLDLEMSVTKDDAGLPDSAESYRLVVDADGAKLGSREDLGLLRGLETLRQLAPRAPGGAWPRVVIRDWPVTPIRGFMHDTGRNFQKAETLHAFLELMARYKYSCFHWHLTDYPAYRIESRRHPELNRAPSQQETRQPGAFYTIAQIKDVIRHAHRLGIEVLPEIDMPGHSAYFNRAFGFGMQDPRGQEICTTLIDEFCTGVVVPLRAEGIPITRLHLGSDEVAISNKGFLPAMVAAARRHHLDVVVWRPGVLPDNQCLTQLWAAGKPAGGVRFIDSRMNYLNHMDAFDGPAHAYFYERNDHRDLDSQFAGAILCHWPDINAGEEANIYRQSPVVPVLITAAERMWRGLPKAYPDLWAKLPDSKDPRLAGFADFERDLVDHGARLAKDWPFPYVAQSGIVWNVLGPCADPGKASTLGEAAQAMGMPLLPATGGTLHFRHFFGKGGVLPGNPEEGTAWAETWIHAKSAGPVGFWIGFDTPSTSDRRAGPVPAAGQWSNAGATVSVNGKAIPGPTLANAGKKPGDEIPFVDEGYFYRAPTAVDLVAGWNHVLLKVPHRKGDWKWSATFAPAPGFTGITFATAPVK